MKSSCDSLSHLGEGNLQIRNELRRKCEGLLSWGLNWTGQAGQVKKKKFDVLVSEFKLLST